MPIRTILFTLLLVASQFLVIGSNQELIDLAKKYKTENNLPKQAEVLYKLGMQEWELSNTDNAISFFEQSISVNQKIGNKNALLNLYTHVGTLMTDQNKLESALLQFRKSLKLRRELGEKIQIISGLLNISTVLKDLDRNYEAIKVAEEALELSKTINNIKFIRSCYGVLAENHKAVGEAAKSMEYYNLYATFDKKINKEEIQKREIEAQTKVALAQKQKSAIEAEKKQTEEALVETEANLVRSELRTKSQEAVIHLKNTELKKREIEEKHQRFLKTTYATGLVVVLLFSFIVFRGYRKIRQKNTEITNQQAVIQKKNHDITNSLNYAKKIQRAMLLPQASLNEYNPESFIFFTPREEVSGDFYYFTTPEFLKTGKISQAYEDLIISAIDCTGHGVPGAFMSMIGFNLLDQIISNNIIEPHLILDNLHDGVHKALKQDQTDNKDGMDMALLRVKREQRIVEYAGAKNPVIYIQNGEMFEVKPCRYPIGGTVLRGRKNYIKHEIQCQTETTFYIFSDGFQDQFGGDRGRKFMTKRFKQLLLDIHTRPMSEQKVILNDTMTNWKGNTQRQIDDILVMGFKF